MKNRDLTIQFNFRLTEKQKEEFDSRYYNAISKGFRGSQAEYLRQIMFPEKQES